MNAEELARIAAGLTEAQKRALRICLPCGSNLTGLSGPGRYQTAYKLAHLRLIRRRDFSLTPLGLQVQAFIAGEGG